MDQTIFPFVAVSQRTIPLCHISCMGKHEYYIDWFERAVHIVQNESHRFLDPVSYRPSVLWVSWASSHRPKQEMNSTLYRLENASSYTQKLSVNWMTLMYYIRCNENVRNCQRVSLAKNHKELCITFTFKCVPFVTREYDHIS